MNKITKSALKVLSKIITKAQKRFKLYRKIISATNPYVKVKYNILDRKIMVNDREIPVRVFRPKRNGIERVLVFFHGGGWIAGNINSYTKICANMAEQTAHTVVSVNYRLAPENPFPDGLEDCYYVTRESKNAMRGLMIF